MADPVSAVLFDVDGTLVDSNYLNTVAWWEAFAQAGHDVQVIDAPGEAMESFEHIEAAIGTLLNTGSYVGYNTAYSDDDNQAQHG